MVSYTFLAIIALFAVAFYFLRPSRIRQKLYRSLDETLEELQQEHELNPKDSRLLRDWGFTLLLADRTDDALEKFQQAARLQPNDAISFWTVALVFAELGRNNEAIEKLHQACQLQSESFTLFFDTFLTLTDKSAHIGSFAQKSTSQEQHTDAIRRLKVVKQYAQSLHQLKPKDAILLHNLGSIQIFLGQFNDALDLFQKACQLQQDNVDMLLKRGIVLSILDRDNEAQTQFRQIQRLQSDPIDLSKAFNNTIQLLKYFNQPDGALKLKESLDRLPND